MEGGLWRRKRGNWGKDFFLGGGLRGPLCFSTKLHKYFVSLFRSDLHAGSFWMLQTVVCVGGGLSNMLV